MKEEAKDAAKAAKVDIVGGMELVKQVGVVHYNYLITSHNSTDSR